MYYKYKNMFEFNNTVYLFSGQSYSSSGVNYERLQEAYAKDTTSAPQFDPNNPFSQPPASGSQGSSGQPPLPVRQRPDENNHRNGDIMYFSID